MIRLYKTPYLIRKLMSSYTWKKPAAEKVLYLTFDDGPIPEVTPFVLDQLAAHQAKATFFCVGENLVRHQEVAQQVLAAEHVLANHTHNHLRGWLTPLPEYVHNVQLCQSELEKLQQPDRQKMLFRPPHGRISFKQAAALLPAYELVMWDVLTNDFDTTLPPEKCLQKAINHTQNGSIIVFHDSLKARRNMMYALPRYLEHFAARGYTFAAL